jgi:DnaJ-class molecular chaperone
METDYYKVLGVQRDASQAEIQQAYRSLAKKYHPDVNPNDKSAARKFQEVQTAFDVLNDPKKRELYDRYGSAFDYAGQAGPTAGGAGGDLYGQGSEDIDLSQFFGERFGGDPRFGGFTDVFEQLRRANEGSRRRTRTHGFAGAPAGGDLHHTIEIPFRSAVTGDAVEISLRRASGKTETLKVKIPAGIDDDKKIRLRGQGEQDPFTGTQGDLLITVKVAAHPFFTRSGNDLFVKVPVSIGEAALGAKVDVPAPGGTVSVRVPAGSTSGTKLRVRGQGVAPAGQPPGDLYAELVVVLPKEMDEPSRNLLRDFEERNKFNPRSELRW